MTVIGWARVHEGRFPELCLLHSIPNGKAMFAVSAAGRKSVNWAAINYFKSEGQKAGVSDLFLPAARGGYFGCYIEMKDSRGGDGGTPEQHDFIRRVREQGYYAEICDGADAAIKLLEWYLALPPTRLDAGAQIVAELERIEL